MEPSLEMLLTSRTFGENLILAWAAFTESPAVLIFTLTDSSCPKPSWPVAGATLKSAAHAELTENIWTRMRSMRGRVVEVMDLGGIYRSLPIAKLKTHKKNAKVRNINLS